MEALIALIFSAICGGVIGTLVGFGSNIFLGFAAFLVIWWKVAAFFEGRL